MGENGFCSTPCICAILYYVIIGRGVSKFDECDFRRASFLDVRKKGILSMCECDLSWFFFIDIKYNIVKVSIEWNMCFIFSLDIDSNFT